MQFRRNHRVVVCRTPGHVSADHRLPRIRRRGTVPPSGSQRCSGDARAGGSGRHRGCSPHPFSASRLRVQGAEPGASRSGGEVDRGTQQSARAPLRRGEPSGSPSFCPRIEPSLRGQYSQPDRCLQRCEQHFADRSSIDNDVPRSCSDGRAVSPSPIVEGRGDRGGWRFRSALCARARRG